jgi:quinone-modifying oxidoreductase subunit QmoC
MPPAASVEPDLDFIKEVKTRGGETLKKCFQCATCSVVCNLSPEDRPFPRKEMIWAQWGLKERLASDPDVWLCHQCSDCSKYCPRGAKPGDVLAALRQISVLRNAFPQFVAKMVNNFKFLPLVFGIPAVLLLALMYASGTLALPEGEIIYRKFIPQWPVVDVLFPLTALWTILCSAIGVRRLWAGFREGPLEKLLDNPSRADSLAGKTLFTIFDILKHSKFKECVVNRARYLAHLNMLWGFILLAITTTCVAAGVYIFGQETPYSLGNPIKWIANVGAAILIVGSLLAISHRLSGNVDVGKATYFDWLFLLVVLFTGITGLLTEILRLANDPGVAYPLYFIHLTFVWFLFAYLPFSKFAHLLYRTTALVYTRSLGREIGPRATVRAGGQSR